MTTPTPEQLCICESLDEAIQKYPDAYVSFAKIADCMICKKRKDLRCGVCWQCQPQVDGEPIKGGHRLWDSKNPENTWYVGN